mgnify:CR=1 FL=1
MQLLWRLIKTQLRRHWKGMLAMLVIALMVSATPYGFAMLGRWLVDDVLQVAGPPKTAQKAEQPAEGEPAAAEQAGKAAEPQAEWQEKTPEGKLRLLLIFFIGSLSIHVFVTGLSVISAIVNQRIVQRITHRLRRSVHEKIASMDLAVFSREQVGQLMTRALDDTAGIPGNLTQLVINVITQIGMLILGAVLLLRLNPRMTLLALGALPFYGIVCWYFLPKLRNNTEDLRTKVAAFNGFMVERLTNVTTIKNYAQEEREIGAFNHRLDENLGLSRRQNRLNVWFNTLTTIITAGATLGVLLVGFLNIRAGRMQLGEVLAFYGVTAQLFVPISALVGMGTVAQTLQVLAQRVYSVLDTPSTLTDAPDARDPETLKGEVEYRDVSLRYQEGGPFAVENVSFTVPVGATACIVGPSGCGKSTLLLLLARLHDPTDGAVCLDGIDIQKLPVRTVRRVVAQVLHDCPVFTGTIAENIAYGDPDATQEQIEHAARQVGLDETITEMPGGYKTRLGTGGESLDAEQLARLGLARAIMVEPVVVTLDDTFSAIEEEAERPLRAAVRTALAGRTMLIATSRLSVCEDADLVVVMQQGKVVQTGTHQEMMEQPGLYRRMYMRQMGMDENPNEK